MGRGAEDAEEFDASFGQYVDHLKRSLKWFRMWKSDDDLPKWVNVSVTLNTAVLLVCNFMLAISELMKLRNAPDLSSVASGVGPFWLHFVGIFKWLYFIWKIRDVMDLVGQLEECYKLSLALSESDESTPRLRKEMTAARKNSTYFTYVWWSFVCYGVIHWCLNPVILRWSFERANASLPRNNELLPFETWIPWDTTHSRGYGWAYLLEFLGGLGSGIGSVCYDTFYVTLISLICAQLRYLNYFLVDDEADDRDENFVETKKKVAHSPVHEKLIRSRIHHNAILSFSASLDTVTSPVIFIQCIGTTGILCLVSFEASTMKLQGDVSNVIKFWSMVEYIVSCFTQLFYFCYYANQLSDLGIQVGDSTYSCGWESADDRVTEKDRKALGYLIREMITRAQKPVPLTGGPFYVLSLETYRAVVAVAYSYLTVLRELAGEE